MESIIFGVLDLNSCQIDISKSEFAAKRYATINGYTTISYRVGYNAFIHSQKIKNKWVLNYVVK